MGREESEREKNYKSTLMVWWCTGLREFIERSIGTNVVADAAGHVGEGILGDLTTERTGDDVALFVLQFGHVQKVGGVFGFTAVNESPVVHTHGRIQSLFLASASRILIHEKSDRAGSFG